MDIALTDNAETVHDKLMLLGADLVVRTCRDIVAGEVHPIPQSQLTVDGPLRPAPKIFKETCRIEWGSHSLKSAYDFIRGLSPYPGAWTTLVDYDGNESVVKVFETQMVESSETVLESDLEPGLFPIETDGRTYLGITVPGGVLRILSLQLAGKRRMSVDEFLRGVHLDKYQGWR